MSQINSLLPAGGGGGAAVEIIRTEDATDVIPVANVINLVGDGGNITTTGAGNTATVHMSANPVFDSVTIFTAPVPAGSGWVTSQSTVNTIGAITSAIRTFPVVANSSLLIKGYIIAEDTTSSFYFGGEFLLTAQRAAGNVAIGVVPILNSITNSATANVTFTVTNPGTVNVNVVGTAGETWRWVCTFSYMYI